MKTRGSNTNPIEPARSKCILPLSTKTPNIDENVSILAPILGHFGYLFRAFCSKVAQGVQGRAPKCAKVYQNGAQGCPNGAQGCQNGSPRSPKVPKRRQSVPQVCQTGHPRCHNGAPRSPKVPQRRHKAPHSATKTPKCAPHHGAKKQASTHRHKQPTNQISKEGHT